MCGFCNRAIEGGIDDLQVHMLTDCPKSVYREDIVLGEVQGNPERDLEELPLQRTQQVPSDQPWNDFSNLQ